jgi:DNA-binding IclR family transcriptional regulator
MSVLQVDIKSLETSVLASLKRSGGEISVSELVNDTKVPYETLDRVLDGLRLQKLVKIDDESGLQIVRSISARASILRFLGLGTA